MKIAPTSQGETWGTQLLNTPFAKRTNDEREVYIERTQTEWARMRHIIEFDREEDGRWIAEVPSLPGVMVYGNTKQEATFKVKALALRVIADKIEHEQDKTNVVE